MGSSSSEVLPKMQVHIYFLGFSKNFACVCTRKTYIHMCHSHTIFILVFDINCEFQSVSLCSFQAHVFSGDLFWSLRLLIKSMCVCIKLVFHVFDISCELQSVYLGKRVCIYIRIYNIVCEACAFGVIKTLKLGHFVPTFFALSLYLRLTKPLH